MTELFERIFGLLPPGLAAYPLAREQVTIALGNTMVLAPALAFLAWLIAAAPGRGRDAAARVALTALVLLSPAARLVLDVTYDTPLALLTLVSDLALVLWIADVAARRGGGQLRPWERPALGIALLLLASLAATLLRAQSIVLSPSPALHVVLGTVLALRIWTGREAPVLAELSRVARGNRGVLALLTAVFVLPFLPHLFIPAPPDADPTTWSEMVGFLFQGQTFHPADSGLPGERLDFRYPAGVPALAWLFAHVLDVRASEALVLLWVLTHALLLAGVVAVVKSVKAPVWIALLFSLNLVITGWFGVHGGQINRELPYALGCFGLVFATRKQWLAASICLAAALACNTLVALPFLLTFGVLGTHEAWSTGLKKPMLWSAAPLAAVLAYLVFLLSGDGNFPNPPAHAFADLTLPTFLDNVTYESRTRFSWASLAFVALVLAVRSGSPRRAEAGPVLVWLVAALLVAGLFGSFRQYDWPSPLFGGFNAVGPWLAGVALALQLAKERLGPRRAWPLAAAFAAIWALLFFPGFVPRPTSVFTTHSDIRMGRWIERNLPRDVLIANYTPYSATWEHQRLRLSYARGDASRHTMFARIEPHHLRGGVLVNRRPFINSLRPDAGFEDIAAAFRHAGATHLMVMARPETEAFVAGRVTEPLYRVGSTWLFDLRDSARASARGTVR